MRCLTKLNYFIVSNDNPVSQNLFALLWLFVGYCTSSLLVRVLRSTRRSQSSNPAPLFQFPTTTTYLPSQVTHNIPPSRTLKRFRKSFGSPNRSTLQVIIHQRGKDQRQPPQNSAKSDNTHAKISKTKVKPLLFLLVYRPSFPRDISTLSARKLLRQVVSAEQKHSVPNSSLSVFSYNDPAIHLHSLHEIRFSYLASILQRIKQVISDSVRIYCS